MSSEVMVDDPRILGVIPARTGSKGVVGKNLRPVAGEPLIGHAIRAARESRRLTTYLVTTDGPEIAEVARLRDCPVLMRPPELAADETPMPPVLRHALEHAEAEHGGLFEAMVLLQPTAPIRTGDDVDTVIGMLLDDPALDSVISVCPVEDEHPARMYELDAEGRMKPLWPDLEMTQRQELPPLYHRNGALYATRRRTLVGDGLIVGPRRRAYVMPRKYLVNIDDERDMKIAEVVVAEWLRGAL